MLETAQVVSILRLLQEERAARWEMRAAAVLCTVRGRQRESGNKYV